jgi:hypothetical protein
LGLTNVRKEARMGSSTFGVMLAGFIEAQLSVDRETDVRGVVVFLVIIFPPADRA